jgi:hypothetical protein
MWTSYKKSFSFMQVMIALITVGVYLAFNHLALLAALFFVTMQVCAVFGAAWASRLTRKIERSIG